VLARETYPVGLDVEVFATDLLAEVGRATDDPHHREHVTNCIYDQPDRYRLRNVEAEESRHRPDLRLTLDTEADLEVIGAVYEALWPDNPAFSIDDVIAFLDRHPEIARRNQPVAADS
jgi:spore coat polysaccharide biosynthesis protein SpsF